jgi:hypothetical protein
MASGQVWFGPRIHVSGFGIVRRPLPEEARPRVVMPSRHVR